MVFPPRVKRPPIEPPVEPPEVPKEELPPIEPIEELPPVEEPIFSLLGDLYPEMFRPEASFGFTLGEIPQMVLGQIISFAQDDPEDFLTDLFERDAIGGAQLLELLGVTPKEIGEISAQFVDIEAEEARITELVTTVFPDIVTPEELIELATENWDLFILSIQEKGRSKETQDLLRLMGFEWEDIGQIFAEEKVWMDVDGVRTLVTVDVNERGIPLVKDTRGRTIGEIDPITGDVIPYQYRIGDTWENFTAGVGDVIVTAGGALKWLGAEGMGENLSEFGEFLQLQAPPDTLGEFEWNYLLNPRWYATKVTRTLPFSLSLIPAAIGGAYAGAAVAGAIGLGKFGITILGHTITAKFAVGALSAGVASRTIESALEAGGTYDEAIAKGLSEAEAREAASSVFFNNLKLAGVDAAQFLIAFAPTSARVFNNLITRGLVKTATIGGRLAIVGLTEAGEEVYQDIIQRVALGEDIVWDAEMKEVAAIGGIMGIGLGGAGTVWNVIKQKTIDSMTPAMKAKFDTDKAGFVEQGFTDKQAELKALDEFAETEEAQNIIENAIDIENIEAFEKEIKPKTEADKIVWEQTFDKMREEITPIEVPAMPEVARTLPLEEVSKLETRAPLDLMRKDDAVEIARLTKEIQETGITEPITIRVREDGSQIVWDGLHRLIIAQDLGIKNIPVQFIGEVQKIPPAVEVAKPPVKPPIKKPPAPPVREIPPTPPPVESSQDKLIRLVKEAKPAREETEILKHEELAKRAAQAAGILETAEGREAFERSKSALRGELPKADFEAVETQLSEEDVKELFNTIKDSDLRYFQKLNTAEALGKVLSGQIPTRGEIELLEDIFGSELAKTLLDKRTLSAKAWELFLDAINLPRAVLASWDLSAPLRQGALMFWGQPKQSLAAFKPMVQAFASEKTTILVAETLAESKYAALRERAGLYQAPLFGVGATLTQREEAFMSRLARWIPLVRRSERAYVTYLNKIRADIFDSYAAHWEGTGKTLKDYKKLAEAINVMSGRGSLGKLSGMAPILSGVFFSPRYQASRISLPITFLTATPVVRRMMARNIVSFVVANFAMLALLKLAGVELEDDPRSADFGKGKIGNTRLDFWAGFQQYARAVVQIMTGMRKVSTTGRLSEVERSEILTRFIRGKLSPVMGFVADIMEGESFVGEPLTLKPRDVQVQAFNRLVPMFVQDLVEAIDDVGILGVLLAMPGLLGVGVQTYGGGYWDEFLDQLGEPISSDTLPYEVDKEDIYTTKNFYSDALSRTRGMTLEDIDPKYGFPALAKSVVETANIKKVHEERPSIALYKIDEDAFELYHNQWLEYQRATDKEQWLKDTGYDKYYMGNFSQRALSLLRRYHKVADKDAFLDKLSDGDRALITTKPRNEWLKANPLDNARLAVFGQAKILSLEAYNEVQRLIKELDIPDDAVPKFTLPPEGSVENYFKYLEQGEELGYNSWEVQSLIAQDEELRTFLDRQPIEAPIEALELKIKHRDLFEEYDLLETDEERKALKEANPQWVADMRRIEAIDNDASDTIIERWVERGKTIDEFGAGSSQAKVWLLDNPETHQWALDNKLLTDDGSDWNENILRINVELEGLDPESDEYKKLNYRKNAFTEKFPEELIDTYVGYFTLPQKPDDYEDLNKTDLWLEDDWYLIEHPEFYKMMVEKGLWEEKDFSKVPTREIFDKYLEYQKLPKGKRRDDFRWENQDLDAWLVLKFDMVPITTKRRRAEFTPTERFLEDVAEKEAEFDEAMRELEELLGGLR